MSRVLLMSDAAWIRDGLRSNLSGDDTVFIEVTSGYDVAAAAKKHEPDLAIFDMQTGSMGGIASCMELRLEESGGRLPHIPVLLLLDRRPDVFLARRSGAEGWLVKPYEAIRLRRAVEALLAGKAYHDDSYTPDPVRVGESNS